MNIDPLSDVVVIRRLPPEQVSDGGIHLAYDPDYKEDIGIVEFVGKGKRYGCKKCGTEKHVGVDVRPGDKVLFSTNGHQITTLDGKEFVILREPSIIGVIIE
jgi:chaperonin GroES